LTKKIPYGRQDVTDDDIQSVINVLKSDFLTQGPTVPQFEKAVAQKVNAKYAVAVNSATSALHIACIALGLGPGDCLWTVPNTFVASANCGKYCGAEVDFVDINDLTWNIDIAALELKLKNHRDVGKLLPKVLVSVHFSGQPTEQEKIWELSKEYGFKVLEDASHSIGASRYGEPVGSCRWSHITVFSFHPVKIITSAEGGMTVTNNPDYAQRMSLIRSHGITREKDKLEYELQGPWYYEQQILGFNYRMTDVQAALGYSQLNRLNYFISRRNQLADRYTQILNELPLQLPNILPENYSSFHLYIIKIEKTKYLTRKAIYNKLRNKGIGVNLHYLPVHLQPYYRRLGFSSGLFPVAEEYSKQAITIPLYPKMTEIDQNTVIKAIQNIYKANISS
jgi:UDP-4-amino-4,6-dideoxy-N-acetyl-beta-L-altrosamine transaminase